MALTEDRLRPEAVPDRGADPAVGTGTDPAADSVTDPAADPAAERARLRALRDARLARLTAVAPEARVEVPPRPAAGDLADPEALVAFLRALTGDAAPDAAPEPTPAAPDRPGAEVLRFARPAAPAADAGLAPAAPPVMPPACDLDRLPGVGPGLMWALRRAGITRCADLAGLAPEDLAARLGPLGRLVPARAWIEAARTATD